MTILTDDQIIAAAGEPVAVVSEETKAQLLDFLSIGTKLYPADAILSAVKPLRERIAELEAEVDTLNQYISSEQSNHSHDCGMHELREEELRAQLNAALAREKVMRELSLAGFKSIAAISGGVISDISVHSIANIEALPHDDTK